MSAKPDRTLLRILICISLAGLFLGSCGAPLPVLATIQLPTANIQQPTANIQQPTANVLQPTANGQTPTANIQQPTANIQQPTANSEQLDNKRARYSLSITLDYAKHFLIVEELIEYTNSTPAPLSKIPLIVEPLLYPAAFELKFIAAEGGGGLAHHQQRETQVILHLRQPLQPGELLSVWLTYELRLPATNEYPRINPRPFGYTEMQVNLGDWYPFIPPYDPKKGWLAHEAGRYGEHLAYESADFEVGLRLSGAVRDLVVAASAAAVADGEWQRFTLPNARNFALSLSPHYQVVTREVAQSGGSAVTVMSYYLPMFEKPGDEVALTTAQALELYARLFGPYPRSLLTAVQADFVDGMEFDGLYFLSKDYYNWYTGSQAEFLVAIAAHETCHQWWYAMVGNDQALEPWLDEALCTYCERLYFEHLYPEGLDWWWTWRVDYYEPRGAIDITVYDVPPEYGSYRDYRDVVYLQGARFLEDLRAQIGDEAFFAFLQDYLRRNTGRIAAASDFFSCLEEHTQAELSDLLRQYMSNRTP